MARYYPHGSNVSSNARHSASFRPLDINDNAFSEWLYDDNWSESKYNTFLALYSVPGISNYMDYLLDRRAAKEYLDRYGMSYSDIHDPRKLIGTKSAVNFARTGYSLISDNVDKLYK